MTSTRTDVLARGLNRYLKAQSAPPLPYHWAQRHFGPFRHLELSVNGRAVEVTEDDVGVVEVHER